MQPFEGAIKREHMGLCGLAFFTVWLLKDKDKESLCKELIVNENSVDFTTVRLTESCIL